MTQEPQNLRGDIEVESSGWKNRYKISSSASLILGVLFLITALGFIASIIWTGTNREWFSMFQSNWLIVIFKLHAGIINIHDDPLHGLNLLDIVILALFSIMCFGLYTTLKRTSKIWPLIAFTLSLIAIILFIVTQIDGRSTVMLSTLMFSLIMLRNKNYNKATIVTGILASVFLLAGDLTVGIHSTIITLFFGIGYVLLTIWFFLIARTPLNTGNHKKVLIG